MPISYKQENGGHGKVLSLGAPQSPARFRIQGSQVKARTLKNTAIYGMFQEGVPSKETEKVKQRNHEKE